MRTVWAAPAKLTRSLRVTGVRDDGFHLLEAEMVTLDLADTLEIDGDVDGAGPPVLDVVDDWPGGVRAWRDLALGPASDNLVIRALTACGRSARVRLVKRIPPGAGLGGGSADAAAVLRWAGCTDPVVASGLGADVPFCVVGGRARVSGIGEVTVPLPYEERAFVLVLPPFGVDTAAVYRAWDRLSAEGGLPEPGASVNDLEAAALVVQPRLAVWRDLLQDATGRRAHLAGSGSTWFVDVDPATPGSTPPPWLEHGDERAPLVVARTSPGTGAVLQ